MGLVSSRHSAKHLLNEQGMKVEQKEAWWPVYCQCTACTLPWEAGEGLSAHLTGAQEDWRAGPGLPQCPRRSQPEEDPQAFTAVRNGPATQPNPPASKNPPHSQATSLPSKRKHRLKGQGVSLGMWWARALWALRSEQSGLSPKENRRAKVEPVW